MSAAPGKLKPYVNKFEERDYRLNEMKKRAELPKNIADSTKRALVVVDVQDGYCGKFLNDLGEDVPGSVKYISKMRSIGTSHELRSRNVIRSFATDEKLINYDKGWNRGIDGDKLKQVVERVVREIKTGKYGLIVFTKDCLEAQEDGGGVFPLDMTPWSDPAKPVALVPHSEYLTFTVDGPGCDVHRDLRGAFPGLTTNGSSPSPDVNGVPMLVLRKQIDDAFNDDTERSLRTNGEAWLDDIDVGVDGKPRKEAETLLTKLKKLGFGPGDAVLTFTGIVTDRCIAASLIHSVTHGYKTELLLGGTAAATDKDHKRGLAMMVEECADNLTVLP